jgi:hypothetical protein
MTADPQAEIVAFLLRPDEPGGPPATMIETHAARVFLSRTRALKLKKPVRFPFLDFSTLARREAACRAELVVNAPFAASLYKGVQPVVRRLDGTLALGGPGETLDWVVEMVRFDETLTLDRLAGRGTLSFVTVEDLGHRLARAHRAAPSADPVAFEAMIAATEADTEASIARAGSLVPAADLAGIRHAVAEALTRTADLRASRARRGLVRRGHGDLHLGNIALIQGRAVPFDALEFDPVVASGDLLYDLAFLVMDLIERGRRAAVPVLLSAWLADCADLPDLDGLSLLPVYVAIRAGIRAKVAVLKREGGGATPDADAAGLIAYAALMRRVLEPSTPRLVALGGLSGTGKSTLARLLAPDLGGPFGAVILRSDVERKTMRGLGPLDRLPPDAYAPEASAAVFARLRARADRILASGLPVIVDAVHSRPEERAAIREVAAACDVPFAGLFLSADLETRLTRVSARVLDASDADAAVARAQAGYDIGSLAGWTVLPAGGNPDALLAAARAALSTA